MNRPAGRVAFYGFLGSGNLGNDASLETVLEWLRLEYPRTELRCITIAPEVIEARYGIPSVPLSAGPRLGRGKAAAAAAKVAGRLADIPRSVTLANSADVVIVPGMGVLEESFATRPWGLPAWMLMTAAACRLRRRPFVLLDVGAEPIVNPVTRRMFAATVNLAAHVSYRDQFSADAMRAAGAREADAMAPDLAFAHSASTHAVPEPGHIVIGVLAYYGPSDDPVQGAAVRRRYVELMSDVVGRLTGAGDRVVLLGGDRVDTSVAQEILDSVRSAQRDLPDHAVTVRDVQTFTELTSELARAEAVVASRFHNLIAALRLSRPTVSVGYAEKSAELMRSVGLADFHQGIDDLDADKLMAQLSAVRAQGPVLSAQIAAACGGYGAQVGALLDGLGASLLGQPLSAARVP
jgi:polysaccharide pyruvyl transferase WcaK-like protein